MDAFRSLLVRAWGAGLHYGREDVTPKEAGEALAKLIDVADKLREGTERERPSGTQGQRPLREGR